MVITVGFMVVVTVSVIVVTVPLVVVTVTITTATCILFGRFIQFQSFFGFNRRAS